MKELAFDTRRDNLPESVVMDKEAKGLMLTPPYINNGILEPMAIGIDIDSKFNGNNGTSPNASDVAELINMIKLLVNCNADMLKALSTGEVNDDVCTTIIGASQVPIGTVLIY